VTQADVDAGSFSNTAVASGTPPTGDPVTAEDTVVTPSEQAAVIAVVKTADVASVANAGDPIKFSFEVTNNGNVTLTNINVSDPQVGAVTCPVTTLAPAESTVCTADAPFLATQTQLDAGQVLNSATVEGTPPGAPPVTGPGLLIIPAPADPSIALVKSSSTTELTNADQVVPFEFLVTNTGNVTLSTIQVADPLTGPVTCPEAILAPGVSTTCTADYVVSQADVDAGRFDNTAVASGTPPEGEPVTATDTVTTPAPAGPVISVDKLAPIGLLELNETIEYGFIVENAGNVTLTDIAVDDPTANPVTCLATTLAPSETTSCSATYVVTQFDIDAGEIVNNATASGTPPADPPVTGSDEVTTTIPANPEIGIVKSSTTTEISTAGQEVPFTFVVTNLGNVTLTNVGVVDPLTGPVECPATTLAPNASITCTAIYSATQADVDAGLFLNTATTSGTPPVGDPVMASDTVTTPAPQGPALLIDKQTPTGTLAVGQTITYAIQAVNVGNVTITNLVVDDPTANPVTCPATTLAPGGSTVCSASYEVTQADIDAGSIVNEATGTADSPAGPITDSDIETTDMPQDPQLSLLKRATETLEAVDQVLNYTFDVTNTGNLTLTGLSISDPLIASVSCPVTTLAPDESVTCTGSYLVTQDDIDAGRVVNVATASATDPSGEVTEATGTETSLGERVPDITLEKQAPSGVFAVNEDITYFFRVTNSGNVTLTNVQVDDSMTTPVTCNFTTLSPGDSTQCSATYTVTQADLDAGQIVNTATAAGTPPAGEDVSSEDTRTTALPVNPSVAVDKQAPTGALVVDQTITYTFVVENTGNVTLTGLTVDDPTANPVTCAADTLSPGLTTTCSANYVVTQTDVDNGEIFNEATVTGQPPTGPPVTGGGEETTPIEQNPSISVAKNSPTDAFTLDAVVTYTFDVVNTGDVTLTNVVVDDEIVGLVDCPVTTLAPGESVNCSGDYVVTQADIDAGNRNNLATVSGTPPEGAPTTGTDEIDTSIPQNPAMTVNKQSSAVTLEADVEIEFTFEVANTGDVTLTDLSIDDPLANPVICPVTELQPGEQTTCRAYYTVTQDDVNANQVTNTATVTAQPPIGPPVVTEGTEIVEGSPDPSINVDKTAGEGIFALGSTIDYFFAITNTGNLTLVDVFVDDPTIGPVTCPATTLDPGDVTICTGTHVVDQDDVDAGAISNSATVQGTDPDGNVLGDQDTEITDIEQVVSVSLDKQAPLGTLTVGETVTYPFSVSNTGTVTLTDVRIDDPLAAPVICDVTTLGPNESTTCTGTHVVTQAEVNAGEIVNVATATGDSASVSTSGTDTEITPVSQAPDLTIAKSGPTRPAMLGETLLYQVTITNTGDVSLTDLSVDDPLTTDEACPRTSLEPGDSMICTASYVVQQSDLDAGEIMNNATATATIPDGSQIGDEGEHTTPAEQIPGITVDKESTVASLIAGEPIAYSFVVANVGTVSLTGIEIADPLVPNVSCSTTSLAPLEVAVCTGTYTVTQADVDRGEVLNEASVSAVPPVGDPIVDTDRETTAFVSNPGLTLTKLAPTGLLAVGETLSWTFELSNQGNVTLSDLAVNDPTAGAVTCSSSVVAPGTTVLCTATSVVEQADVDAGEIINVATASASDPSGTTVQAVGSVTQQIEQTPALTVTKTTDAELVEVGDAVVYDITATNSGNVTLTNVIVSDPLAPVTCPIVSLLPGEMLSCRAALTVTQEMVNAGSIVNTVTVRAGSQTGIPIEQAGTSTVSAQGFAELTVEKQQPNVALRLGVVAQYSIVVTNTGLVDLTNIDVVDPLTPSVDCPSTTLTMGESMTCSTLYTVTQADVSRGEVRNTATATANGPTGQRPVGTDVVETTVESTPVTTYIPPLALEPIAEIVTQEEPPELLALPAPEPVADGPPLAQTGTEALSLTALAMMLLVIGGFAILSVRRRRAHPDADYSSS